MNNSTEIKPIPGLSTIPVDVKVPRETLGIPSPSPFDDIYILRFVFRKHIEEKAFKASGGIMDIVSRAKAHCEQCGYRFLEVKPFLSDFVKDEVKHRASY